MTHYDDAVARGACPHASCTTDRKATWHNDFPCPFADEAQEAEAS